MPDLVFLPGAGGSASFWQPVADKLNDLGEVHLFGYPGFGETPADSNVKSLDDLFHWIVERLPTGRSHVIPPDGQLGEPWTGPLIAAPRPAARPAAAASRPAQAYNISRPRWIAGKEATMVPQSITRYLEDHHTPFRLRAHRRAVTAQETAAAIHEPGDCVAKAVIVDADERRWIAVLPATELLDRNLLAEELHARQIRLVDEPEFARQFPDCEVGAEPPFGGLYGLPVIADETLARQTRVYLRAGSHEECVELSWSDFDRLEHPHVAAIGSPSRVPQAQRVPERRV